MAQPTQDLSRLIVSGCDLFLLEHWKADSALSPDEQMRHIFARFLELPLPERQVYTQRVLDRNVYFAERLQQAEQHLLALARPYHERKLGQFLLLRTYYGPGSDAAFAAVVEICEAYGGAGPDCVFSDPARYDYGDDWQRVFGRMPQRLEVGAGYEEERAAEWAEARAREEEDEEVEELGGWTRDDFTLAEWYNRYHLVSRAGVIYVLDEETLGEAEEGDGSEVIPHKDRELLVVWYDAHGKTVRWRRSRAIEISQEMAVINTASIDDLPVWTEAEVGEDYDWDGPFSPPSTEEGEESESEEDA